MAFPWALPLLSAGARGCQLPSAGLAWAACADGVLPSCISSTPLAAAKDQKASPALSHFSGLTREPQKNHEA